MALIKKSGILRRKESYTIRILRVHQGTQGQSLNFNIVFREKNQQKMMSRRDIQMQTLRNSNFYRIIPVMD